MVARAVILTLSYLTEPDILTEPGHTYRVITPLMAARIRFGVITPEPFLRHNLWHQRKMRGRVVQQVPPSPITTMSDIVTKLKEQGNAEFRNGKYRPAINVSNT